MKITTSDYLSQKLAGEPESSLSAGLASAASPTASGLCFPRRKTLAPAAPIAARRALRRAPTNSCGFTGRNAFLAFSGPGE